MYGGHGGGVVAGNFHKFDNTIIVAGSNAAYSLSI